MLEQIGIRKSELNQKLLHLKSDEAQQVQILEKLQKSYEAINENVRKMKQSYEEVDVHRLPDCRMRFRTEPAVGDWTERLPQGIFQAGIF